MSKRALSIFLVVVCFLAVVFFVKFRNDKDEAPTTIAENSNDGKFSGNNEIPKSPGSDSLEAKSPIRIPSKKIYIEQARENPHRVPAVMMDFAHSISDLMEGAHRSDADALAAFIALESCARDSSSEQLDQVRAICAINAKRLGEERPGILGDRAQILLRALPDGVDRIVRGMEAH